MIRINLLAERKQAATTTAAPGALQAYVIIGALAGLAVAGSAFLYIMQSSAIADLEKKIKAEQDTKTRLTAVKKQVDDLKAKQGNLEQKMKVFEDLKSQKGAAVHLLDQVSKSLPDFVWLSSLDQTGPGVKFAGEGSSMTAVADFMTALSGAKSDTGSQFFPSVELGDVKESNRLVAFTVSATYQAPQPVPSPEPAPAGAAPAPPAKP